MQSRWARGLLTVSGANILVLTMTSFAAMLMPIVLDVKEYAYWQLFGLYSSFLGFFVLGFNDGLYLNYSHHNVMDRLPTFKAFLKVVVSLGAVGAVALLAFGQMISLDKSFALSATGVCVMFYGANGFFAYVNQMRLQFGRYSTALVIEKSVFVVAVTSLFAIGADDYRLFVIASIGAGLVKLAFNVASNWAIVAVKGHVLVSMRPQIGANFRQGFLLMLSVLMCASVLVPARLIVERQFGIEAFGIFSFALTAVSIVTLCVISVGQIIYPMLRRVSPELYPAVLEMIHQVSTNLAVVALGLFFLVELLVPVLYGQYATMLLYLAFLFPTCVFQSKYILLVLTEQKLDRSMVRAVLGGAAGIGINLLVTLIAWSVFGSVEVIALACLIGYILWFYPWWLALRRRKGLKIRAGAFADLLVAAMFVLTTVVAPTMLPREPWGWMVSCGVYMGFASAYSLAGWIKVKKQLAALRFTGRLIAQTSSPAIT